jgi:hypothetical protein
MPIVRLVVMLARKNKANIARITRYLRFVDLILRVGGEGKEFKKRSFNGSTW